MSRRACPMMRKPRLNSGRTKRRRMYQLSTNTRAPGTKEETTRTSAPAMHSLLVLPLCGTRRERMGTTPRASATPSVTQHCALRKSGRFGLRLCSRRMATPGAPVDQRTTSVSSMISVTTPSGQSDSTSRSS